MGEGKLSWQLVIVREIVESKLKKGIMYKLKGIKLEFAHLHSGVDILFLLFPASRRLVSAHFKEKYLSYLYQIWYGCLLGFNSLHGVAFGEDRSIAN